MFFHGINEVHNMHNVVYFDYCEEGCQNSYRTTLNAELY
jgi:hypothetical protein